MKVINKILCFLSVLVLCVPLLCFNVSAEDSTSYDYSFLYGTSFSSFTSSYAITELKKVSDGPFLNGSSETGKPNLRKSDYWKEGTNGLKTNYIGWVEPSSDDYYVMDNTINNVLLLALAKSRFGYWVDRSQAIYYYCYSYVYKESDTQIHKNYEFYFSNSPLTFSSCTNSYCDYVKLNSIDSSHVSVYTFLDELDGVSYPNSYAGSGLAVNSLAVCGSQVKSGNEICFKSGEYGQVMIEEQYVNSSRESQFKCNLDSFRFDSSFSNHDIDSSCFSSGTVDNVSDIASDKILSDQIDVSLTPEFGLDMDILNSSDDRFKFSVTNNTDKPIQFCVYIDEPGNDNSYLGDYVVNPAYTNAAWNYKISSYYYDIDITDNSKFLGFVVDNVISPVKCHGSTVWVYLDSGQTYSDYVYWKNVSLATGKYYNINFIACFVPDNLDIVSNIFDVELLADPVILSDFNPELRNDHWWTIDLLSDVIISDKMNSYNISYVDVSIIYQQKFSLVSIPDYSAVSVGGNGIVSNGYKNDLSEFHDRDYTYNLDTGKESFISSGAFSNDFDMDNVSVDNVKSYITYCTDFFSLIKGTLSTFPNFIWVLIFFGLSAFVVVAIVKWIIS